MERAVPAGVQAGAQLVQVGRGECAVQDRADVGQERLDACGELGPGDGGVVPFEPGSAGGGAAVGEAEFGLEEDGEASRGVALTGRGGCKGGCGEVLGGECGEERGWDGGLADRTGGLAGCLSVGGGG